MKIEKALRWPAGWLAFILTLCLVTGHEVSEFEYVDLISVRYIGSFVVVFVLLFLVCSYAFMGLRRWSEKRALAQATVTRRSLFDFRYPFVLCMAIMMLCWLPIWLASWPATFSGDSYVILWEVDNNQVSRAFPVFYTYVIGGMIAGIRNLTGSVVAGCAITCLVQMIFMAGIYTAYIFFFKRKTGSRLACYIMLVFYCIDPVIQLFSKDLVRDVAFSLFVMLMGFVVYYALNEPEAIFKKWYLVVLSVALLFVTMNLRNVAVFFVAALGLVVLIRALRFRSMASLKAALLVACALLLYVGYSRTILLNISVEDTARSSIEKSGSSELLSVPMQQVARVVNTRWFGIDEWEQRALLQLNSEEVWLNYYDPKNVDGIKYTFNRDQFEATPEVYIEVYMELMKAYPQEYLNAFLVLNTEVWYPDTIFEGYRSFDNPILYYSPGNALLEEDHSLFPWLAGIQDELSYTDSITGIPVLNLIFSPAVALYVLLFAIFYLSYRRERTGMCLLLCPLILHLGTLFCPVVNLRYNLITFMAVPIALALIINPQFKLTKE